MKKINKPVLSTAFPKKAVSGSLRKSKPPSAEAVMDNLSASETAPSNIVGRPKSNKTQQFSTKFTPEFYKQLKKLSFDYEIDMSSIIEEAVLEWKKSKNLKL